VKDFLERVPLHRLLSVLQIPHDRLPHTREFRKLGLGQPRLLAVVLDELSERDHYCFNGKKWQQTKFASSKHLISSNNYCLRGNYGVFQPQIDNTPKRVPIITVKAVLFTWSFPRIRVRGVVSSTAARPDFREQSLGRLVPGTRLQEHLAIEGYSNSGPFIGTVLNWRRDLYAVALPVDHI